MAKPIAVSPAVRVPEAALTLRAVRSRGPGGQNVNKVASKVELHVDLDRIEGLTAPARQRLKALAAARLDAEGRLLVVSQRTRDQHKNLEDAREKVRALIARALVVPRRRRATEPPPIAREKRIQEKRRVGERKRARARPIPAEE